MDRSLPAWGIYRLLKALGDKKATGLLNVQFEGGRTRFIFKQGFVTDCHTDIVTLSFGTYLNESGLVPDRDRALSMTGVEQLVSERVVRAEDSVRLHTNYVRSVLGVLMPEPVLGWSFAPSLSPESAGTEEAVDVCAELFTVVQTYHDTSMMRQVVERFGPAVRVTQSVSPACVMHARAHFKSSLLVSQLLAGTCTVINPDILDDDRSLRILFAFAVAGCLGACTPEDAVFAPPASGSRPGRRNTREARAHAAAAAGQVSPARPSPAADARPEFAWPEFQEVSRRLSEDAGGGHLSPPGGARVPQQASPVAPPPPSAVSPAVASSVSNGLDFVTSGDADEPQAVDSQSPTLDVDGDVPDVVDSAFDGFGDAPRKAPVKVRKKIDGKPNPIDPYLEDALNAETQRAAGLNHYELLEINADARLSSVRMAVLRARRRFSVSRYEGSVSADALLRLHGLLDRIEKANDVLNNLDARVAYNRSLGISSPALESVLVAMFDAREMWRQGTALLDGRKINEALEKFENAESYDAEEPLYLCSQGMAMLALPPADDTNETIEGLIDVAFSFDQDLVEAHILAAHYMVRRNDHEAARTHIRKVLAIDPDNRDARSFKQKSRVSQVGAQVSFKKKQESLLDKALKLIKR